MHFKGVHVGKIIETVDDLVAHSYPLLSPPRDEKPAEKPAKSKSKKEAPPPPPPSEPPPPAPSEVELAVPVDDDSKP